MELMPNLLRNISRSLESINKKLEGFQQAQCVWVFTAEQAWDGEATDIIVKSFGAEQAARKYMQKFINDGDGDDETVADYVKRKGWKVEYNTPDLYRAYEDGYYVTNHIELTITKCEIEK